MARGRHLLTARTVATLKEPGRYADGDGLYLMIRDRGNGPERLWLFRYRRGGRGEARETALSIGPARNVTLATARDQARRCREALAAGQDPREVLLRTDVVPTFGEMADDLIEAIAPSFTNPKHIAQWKMTLGDTYCARIRCKPVDEITTEDVLGVLKPIWLDKAETASRVRGRIERVLNRAKVLKHRAGENPALWRGHLDQLLPKPPRLSRGHHRAMPWADVPAFMERLRRLDSVSALALEWTILTAVRTNEAAEAPRAEIDRTNAVWIIPKERMKAGSEHRVPLCSRTLEIFDELAALGSTWLFPSTSLQEPLSLSAMAECLKGFAVDATVHGFRSSFRDWAGDATSFPKELAEAALAHAIGNKTEAAYRRATAVEKRRKMMAAWERYLSQPGGNVVKMVVA